MGFNFDGGYKMPEEAFISPEKMNELVSLAKHYKMLTKRIYRMERIIQKLREKQEKIKVKVLEL